MDRKSRKYKSKAKRHEHSPSHGDTRTDRKARYGQRLWELDKRRAECGPLGARAGSLSAER